MGVNYSWCQTLNVVRREARERSDQGCDGEQLDTSRFPVSRHTRVQTKCAWLTVYMWQATCSSCERPKATSYISRPSPKIGWEV